MSMPAANEEPVVLMHVHVRKCGGVTFYQDVLRANLGDGFYRDSSLIDDRYSRSQVDEILDHCPWLTGYSSHKISLDLPYDRTDRNLCAIAIVRDPVHRFLSHYSYLCNHPRNWDQAAKQLGINKYIDKAISEGWLGNQRQHSQLEQLSNRQGAAAVEWIEQVIAESPVILCPIDRFDDLCLMLERRFPGLISDASYSSRTNTSPETGCTESSELRLRDALDDHEFQLVDIVRKSFSALFAETFAQTEDLQQLRETFRARCESRTGWLGKFRFGR